MVALAVLNQAFAHGVDDSTKQFILSNDGAAFLPYVYIGAKHMVTGYDHILFLVGVVFFLFRLREIVLFVSLFTLGHSATLLAGVYFDLQINPYLIDAVIGFSVFYKGFDNLGGFKNLLGFQPNLKLAVFAFGLCHGFGLATKIQEFDIPENGRLANLLAFNLGVELGQVVALTFVVLLLSWWRRSRTFLNLSVVANVVLMALGTALAGYQLLGFLVRN